MKNKKKQLYLDVTSPNTEGNYYLLNMKNKIIGEVPASTYRKHPDHYMTDEITPITSTGWRKKKKNESKSNRKNKCECK